MSCGGVTPHYSPDKESFSDHPVSFDPNEFSLAAVRFQNEALTSGIKDAETQARQGIKLINRTTEQICEKAYAQFERTIREAFGSSASESLLTLTVQSRNNLFFGMLPPENESLKQRVKKILLQSVIFEKVNN